MPRLTGVHEERKLSSCVCEEPLESLGFSGPTCVFLCEYCVTTNDTKSKTG